MSGTCAKCQERYFPLLCERDATPHPRRIPWGVADEAYAAYAARHGTGQSLERIAERGGFAPCEMDELLPGWRMKARVEELLRRQLANARKETDRLQRERAARIYYQNIVYDICIALDKIDGLKPGHGIVCGCLEMPSKDVQARMTELAKDLRRLGWVAGETAQAPTAGGGSEGGGG